MRTILTIAALLAGCGSDRRADAKAEPAAKASPAEPRTSELDPAIAETERAIAEAKSRLGKTYGSINGAKAVIAGAPRTDDPSATKAQGERELAAAETEQKAAWEELQSLERTLARLRAEAR